MTKKFWGYNSQEDAEQYWPKELLGTGVITTKEISVIDDATKWPQTSSTTKTVTRIELAHDIISY